MEYTYFIFATPDAGGPIDAAGVELVHTETGGSAWGGSVRGEVDLTDVPGCLHFSTEQASRFESFINEHGYRRVIEE